MICTDARSAIEAASRVELRAEGDSELAAHLRECANCRMTAMRLEAGTDLLAEMVASRRQQPLSHVPDRRDATGGRRLRRAAMLTLVPLAAAAGFILLRGDATSRRALIQSDAAAPVVAVDAGKGQTATVIKTRDPNVTIIWLTPTGAE